MAPPRRSSRVGISRGQNGSGKARLVFGRSPHERVIELPDVLGAAERLMARKTPRQQAIAASSQWQKLAFAYYDRLGEIHYAAQFHGNALSKIRLYVGELDDEYEISESTDEKAMDLLRRVRDPSGGRAMLQSRYAELMFTIGESLLLWWIPPEEIGPPVERWEMISPDEITQDGNRYTRRVGPGVEPITIQEPSSDTAEPGPGSGIVYRLWRPHPRWSHLPDSPMRAVLDLCEELVLLESAVKSQATSRLTRGILKIPFELNPDGRAPTAPGDENVREDPFMDDMIEHTSTPIKDPTSASGQLPYFLYGPQAALEGLDILHLQQESTYPEEALRTECIRRIALGLDLPPEVLLGMTDANHWTAWQVEQQTWKSHLLPVAQQLCNDLTASYLQPAAERAGIENWEKLVVAYDAAEILSNPDKAKDWAAAFRDGAISEEAYRDAIGANDEHEPEEEDRRFYLAVALSNDQLLPEEFRPEPPPAPVLGPDGMPIPGAEDEAGLPLPPDAAAAQEEAAAPQNVQAAAVLAAATVAFLRCREKAGGRITSAVQHHPELAAQAREHTVRSRGVACDAGEPRGTGAA